MGVGYDVITHYTSGPPFHSLMDLDPAERAALLQAEKIDNAARYRDPTYVATRRRIEATMRQQFIDAGGRPLRAHPHYALLGRSERLEATATPGRRACVLAVPLVPPAHTTFTWGDSFRFDPHFREVTGQSHPASGRAYPWNDLAAVLSRWADSVAGPAWQEVEVQLWFDPSPSLFEVIDLA